MTLHEIGTAIRVGELSPTEHITAVLHELADDPYNVVTALDAERALAQARLLSDELTRGHWRGPLHGIALGVKDLFDVTGLPTRAGSNVLDNAAPATTDAAIVAQLRAAGAVVVAKLHTHEFAYGPTGDVAATGPARNPHDPTRITGGSSSGSAAAVAAGYLPLALGTDTGASVRTPAALCGVVGLKPTLGRISTAGVFPLSETCDHVGFVTADVRDAAVVWDAGAWSAVSGSAGIDRPLDAGLRVGVLVDDYWRAVDPVLTAAVSAAVDRLGSAGARISEIRTPMIEQFAATFATINGAEAFATHADLLAEHPSGYQPITRRRLEGYADLSARDYITALRDRLRLGAAFRAAVDGVDVLVLATTRIRATPIGVTKVVVDGVTMPVRSALLDLTLPFNLTGWPAISVPVPAGDGGLPAAVQIVGVGLDERDLLRVAETVTRP